MSDKLRKRALSDLRTDCHHHFSNVMFDELAERFVMSALTGTKHSYVTLVIVKFSGSLYSSLGFVAKWYFKVLLIRTYKVTFTMFSVEVSDKKIMSNAKSRRYFHLKLQQGDHETWVV